MHDIYATPADRPRWYNKAVVHYESAYGLHPRWTVQTEAKSRSMAGVPSAVQTVDAFVKELDPGGIGAVESDRVAAFAALLPGEVALMLDVVDMALTASCSPVDSEDRRGARAWLQDHSSIYRASMCFEVLGYDYDVVRKLLLKRWLKMEGK